MRNGSLARPLFFLLFLAFALIATSCGGDPLLSEDDRNLAARMSDTFPLGSPETPVEADETNCIAEKVVGEIGSERLAADYGITRETIAEGRNPWRLSFKVGDAELIAGSSIDCIDWNRFLSDRFVSAGMSTDVAQCMANNIDLDLIKKQAANEYQGKPPLDDIEDQLDANFAAAGSSCSP